jgi:hypothetical protein
MMAPTAGGLMFGRNKVFRRLWRPFIGIVVAYAVAAQSLLIVLGGFSSLAQADTAAPAFEICHHEGGVPGLPANVPDHPGCNHCIFCFAGSHHALMGSPPALFTRLDVAVIEIAVAVDKHHLPRLSAHSIASPRGPPLQA